MKFFFDTLINFLVAVANLFLTPVNNLLVNVFPSFTDKINQFNSLINNYLGNSLSYFFHILPPNTQSVVLIYLSLLMICITITFSIHVILKIIAILRNVKIW